MKVEVAITKTPFSKKQIKWLFRSALFLAAYYFFGWNGIMFTFMLYFYKAFFSMKNGEGNFPTFRKWFKLPKKS